MAKKIQYRAISFEQARPDALANALGGAQKLVVAIDVAKTKMMAGFAREDGLVVRLVEVFDGVPSMHDAKACVVIARLHHQGVSKLYIEPSPLRVRLRALVEQRELYRVPEPCTHADANRAP